MKEDMMQVYVLDTIQASDHRLSAGGQWVNDERVVCPVCGVFLDSSEPSEIQIALNHLGRQGFAEFLWNSHTLPIFRQDVIDLWRSQGFTGFAIKPVRIVGWCGKPNKAVPKELPTYWRVFVTSRVKMIYPRFTGVCSGCGDGKHDFEKPHTELRLPESMKVDESSWNGSDIFGVHASDILCTRRVAEVTLAAGFNQHIAFVRLEDYQRWKSFDIHKWEVKDYERYVEAFLIRKPRDL